MLVSVLVDPSDIADIRRGIDELRRMEAVHNPDDAERRGLREVLALNTARIVHLAHEHFGTEQFDLHRLADASGERVRVLHGMTGSLGRACDSRHVEVWNRHGGQPLVLSVRPEVAALIDET
ncbi:MAG TPA: hypothetical protein VIK18_21905 [Pirellulales bacterium]